jgi:hypothetical protein
MKLVLLALALSGAAGCSHSSSSSSASSSTTLDPTSQTALQALVTQLQPYAKVPSDPATRRAAAQIQELAWDMAVQNSTAALLLASEQDPGHAGQTAAYEAERQKDLAQAASDLAEIRKLQGSGVPGQSTLASDGGAQQVIVAILGQGFTATAQNILNAGASGKPVPSDDQISSFLSQVAIVMGDEGVGGHEVASRILQRVILSDAGFSTADSSFPISTFLIEGGAP